VNRFSQLKKLMSSRRIMIGLVVLWLGALLGAGVPGWLKVERQHQEIRELDQRLAELDRWHVAGMWLARSLVRRQTVIDGRWNKLFPPERRRSELFLDLARIADDSGVQSFELVELGAAEMGMTSAGAGAPAPGAGMGTGAIPEEILAKLDSYRVQARFQGGYEQVARFLGGLNSIERAVRVHNLDIRPSRDDIMVELELDIHVSKMAQS